MTLGSRPGGKTGGGTTGKSAYQSALDTGTIPAGTTEAQFAANLKGLNHRNAWTASTAYAINDTVTYQGSTYRVVTAFTSGASFSATNLAILAQAGTNGTSVVNRGVWTGPGTVYAQGDLVVYQNQLYSSNTAHTSSASFVPANWTLSVARGADSVVPGPNPQVLTGTGGTPLNLLLRTPGSTVFYDAEPRLISNLLYQPLYMLGNDGKYYRCPALVPIGAGLNLTAGQIVALSAKTSPTGRNWTTFDGATGVPGILDLTSTQMYVPVGVVSGDPTFIEFDAPVGARISDGTPGTSVYDNFDAYANGVPAALTTNWQQQWSADSASPGGLYIEENSAGSADHNMVEHPAAAGPEHIVVRKSLGMCLDCQEYVEAALYGDGTYRFDGLVGARITGAPGSETGVFALLTGLDNSFSIVQYLNGVRTELAKMVANNLNGSTFYRIVIDLKQTFVQAKYWAVTEAEPAGYMASAYTTVNTPGYVGSGTRSNGYLVWHGIGIVAGSGVAPRA